MSNHGDNEPDGAKPAAGSNYKVGYKKPPKSGQFQKGQSGNSNGRPKGARNRVKIKILSPLIEDMIIEELERSVTLKGGQSITTYRAIFKAQLKAALQGSPTAQRDIIRTARTLYNKRLLESENDFKKLYLYKINEEKRMIFHKKNDIEYQPPGVHPDDIHVDIASSTIKVSGPISQYEREELEFCKAELISAKKTIARLDDTWMLSSCKDQRQACEIAIKKIMQDIAMLESIIVDESHLTPFEIHRRKKRDNQGTDI